MRCYLRDDADKIAVVFIPSLGSISCCRTEITLLTIQARIFQRRVKDEQCPQCHTSVSRKVTSGSSGSSSDSYGVEKR